MTIESFNLLSDPEKVELIFDADKITEKVDDKANYQLFQINNFFVEAKTSLNGKFKRSFTAYSLKELPVDYAGEVLLIPIVTLNSGKHAQESESIEPAKKKVMYAQAR